MFLHTTVIFGKIWTSALIEHYHNNHKMADPSKSSLFGFAADDKSGQPGKETSLFPPPSTPAVNLEVPKDKNDMLTSFTVPVSMTGPKRPLPNGEDSKIEKKENSQIGTTADNSKVQGEKIGGPMSGAS